MNIYDIAMPVSTGVPVNSTSQNAKVPGQFGQMLQEALAKVNNDILTAEQLAQDFALGKNVELHQVVIAAEQANLALQLTIQIRNKILDAYQEIMRMQV